MAPRQTILRIFTSLPDRLASFQAIGLITWAAMLAVALYYAAFYANVLHAERWPLRGDTASYWSRDIGFSHVLGTGPDAPGYRAQALEGAKHNPKDPIRTAFYALLPPDAASALNGHLVFSGIAIFLFLSTLAVCLWRRSGSFLYALGAPLVAILPQGLLDTMYGLPSKLPDLPASFLFGSALFAIFSARADRRSELLWIFFAGLLLGLATLSRFQVWMYGLFALGPIVFIFGVRRFFNDSRRYADLLIYPGLLVTGLVLVAGFFIYQRTTEMLHFYSVAGYSLNSTIALSLSTTGLQFISYFGIAAGLAGLMMFAVFVAMRSGAEVRSCRWDNLAVAWGLLAYPILLFVVVRVDNIIEQSYYIVPGLLVFLLAPFATQGPKPNSQFRVFAAFLLVIMPVISSWQIYHYLHSESFLYPRENEAAVAKFQHDLAELVAVNIPQDATREYTIDSNFNYYGRFIEIPVRSRFGRNGSSMMLFQIRQSQWQLTYTGEMEKDKELITQDLAKRIDVFMALTQPDSAAMEQTFIDGYTEALARHVNHALETDTAVWENRGTVSSPHGVVTVYKNRTRDQ